LGNEDGELVGFGDQLGRFGEGIGRWGSRERRHTPPLAMLLIGPELKPVLSSEPRMQGVLKSPCTAVWKVEKKWNSSVSPTSAVTVLGEKVSPLWPTLIWTIFATALLAIKAKALRAMDECIVMICSCGLEKLVVLLS
jgi:hypothetical protein